MQNFFLKNRHLLVAARCLELFFVIVRVRVNPHLHSIIAPPLPFAHDMHLTPHSHNSPTPNFSPFITSSSPPPPRSVLMPPPPSPPPPRPPRRPRSRFSRPASSSDPTPQPTVAPPPYLPPFRRRRRRPHGPMPQDPDALQRDAWHQTVQHVHLTLNRVAKHNVAATAKSLFRINLVRARGVFAKSILRLQVGSPGLSDVLAALVAVVNSRMPGVVALLIARVVAQLKTAWEVQDRDLCFATGKFVAALYKQSVVQALVVLQLLWMCLDEPSEGSIELAVGVIKSCGGVLDEKEARIFDIVCTKLRDLLHEGHVSKRAMAGINVVLELRRKGFADALEKEFDLLDEDDVVTHMISLEEGAGDVEEDCNAYKFDPNFDGNEKEYDEIRKELLGAEYDEPIVPAESDDPVPGSEDRKVEDTTRRVAERPTDLTGTDLVDFRRKVYLIFTSGISHEEWAHKVLKFMRNCQGRELELCKMVVECCSEEKSYLRSFGLLGHRLCLINRIYVENFEETFATHYATTHNFTLRKIRNMARFYGALLATDALSWDVLQVVKLVEEETTSSSRIFLKEMFREMASTLGKATMKKRLKLDSIGENLRGIFPMDTAQNAKFSIKFFTTIGLEYLTKDLADRLGSLPQGNTDGQWEHSFSSDPSSSLSSSSLSSSSDEDEEMKQDKSSKAGAKRLGEQTSPPQDERPRKFRRKNYERRDGKPRSSEQH